MSANSLNPISDESIGEINEANAATIFIQNTRRKSKLNHLKPFYYELVVNIDDIQQQYMQKIVDLFVSLGDISKFVIRYVLSEWTLMRLKTMFTHEIEVSFPKLTIFYPNVPSS